MATVAQPIEAGSAVVTAPLLQMEGIRKAFPGVLALRDARLELRRGEVHALLGENGAGKSTLVRILSGAHRADAGTIRLDGRPVHIASPLHARRLGIAVMYQEFNLVPAMTVRENLFLGRETTRGSFCSPAAERRQAEGLFQRINARLHPEALCRDLTVAQQQCVEIAKALSQQARIIAMDEPSAALSEAEVERLFATIRELTAQGIGIIYISHRLGEVLRIADRATVMRDGQTIATEPVPALTRRRIIEMMVGRTLDQEYPKQAAAVGAVRLEVRGLRRGRAVKGVSFSVRRGEVLGLTGLVGAGRTELVRLVFGADRADAGEVRLDGQALRIRSPRDAIRAGICLLTEDRKAQGLVLGLPVRENFALPNLSRLSRLGFIRAAAERTAFARRVEELSIRIPHQEQLARNLSGGNQQKVVLAKWLEANSEVVLFDEPTRGIDVGAKYGIYLLINRLAAAGKAIVMISSELPEVLGMSDRILVMHEGRVSGEVTDVKHATQEQVMALAAR
jgi:ABC-type sugar transport system ATPase subunit